MKYSKTQKLVLDWAEPKGLLDPENVYQQFAKLMEEANELLVAINKLYNTPKTKPLFGTAEMLTPEYMEAEIEAQDAIGDIKVVLIILAKQLNLDDKKCLEWAYDEIKNRTGKTVNGTFVKD